MGLEQPGAGLTANPAHVTGSRRQSSTLLFLFVVLRNHEKHSRINIFFLPHDWRALATDPPHLLLWSWGSGPERPGPQRWPNPAGSVPKAGSPGEDIMCCNGIPRKCSGPVMSQQRLGTRRWCQLHFLLVSSQPLPQTQGLVANLSPAVGSGGL